MSVLIDYTLHELADLFTALCKLDVSDLRGTYYSVNPVASSCEVDGFEGGSCALVENALAFEAFIFIVVVGTHACSEGGQIEWAELLQNILARGALIFSGEATESMRLYE